MITFHPGFFARECPESEAEAVIAAAPNATHATGDYYKLFYQLETAELSPMAHVSTVLNCFKCQYKLPC